MPRLTSTRYYGREALSERFAPKTDYNDNIVKPPAPDLQPAKWLPIEFKLSSAVRGESPFVIAKGKVVAMERGGDYGLVPAGIGLVMQAGELSYTADDVTYQTLDLVTGATVTGAVTYTALQCAGAILEHGWVTPAMVTAASLELGGSVDGTTDLPRDDGLTMAAAEINAVIHAFISGPIGFAPAHLYPYLGQAETADFKFTNWAPQHKANFHTQWVLQLPRMVAAVDTQAVDGSAAAETIGAELGEGVTVGEWIGAAAMAGFQRFSSRGVTASSNVAFVKLTDNTLAANTIRTPLSEDNGGVLLRERSSIAAITKAGDFWVDEQYGGLVLYSTAASGGWETIAANVTFTFYDYASAAATTGTEAGIYGDVRPGDRLTFDKKSNYVLATSSTLEHHIVGRLYHFLPGPRGGLERVRTAYHDSNFGATSRVPGSATDGYSDLIVHASENSADTLALVRFAIKS